MKQDDKKISRFLAYVLRHHPESINLDMDEHGWVEVSSLLENMKDRFDISYEKLEEIVRKDEKGRYAFNEDKTCIRANQGHSIKVDLELEECTPPKVLYHGTAVKYQKAIEEEGINPQTRCYVHLSEDIETAIEVGKRHGEVIIYQIDTKKMQEYNLKFYKSQNGVWLTTHVPPDCIEILEKQFILKK